MPPLLSLRDAPRQQRFAQWFFDRGLQAYWRIGALVLSIFGEVFRNVQLMKDVPADRFTAMTRLDENRAVAMLARKLEVGVEDVQDLVVWGNHSPTMFPDLFNAKVNGERAVDKVDLDWYENEYMPLVGKRGALLRGRPGCWWALAACAQQRGEHHCHAAAITIGDTFLPVIAESARRAARSRPSRPPRFSLDQALKDISAFQIDADWFV